MNDRRGGKARTSEIESELADLLRKIARQCESALGKLYDLTVAQVYGLALKILSSASEADEVALDVFKQVWNKALDYSPERGTPSAWLITLTRSRAIDRLRADARRKKLQNPMPEVISSPASSPEEKTETREKRALIESALSELTAGQRRSIELAYFHGLTQTEISAHMKEPLGTVKSWMRAGMMKLREIIGSKEPGDPGE